MKYQYIKCHQDCLVGQCIAEAGGDPSEVCEWSEGGICVLDTGAVNNGMSLESVGVVFGVTRERIRQIEERALKKLKTMPEVIDCFETIRGFRPSESP